jgi:hypothetical protein
MCTVPGGQWARHDVWKQTGNQLPVSVISALPSGRWGNINAAVGQKLKVVINLHFGTFGR